MGAEESALQLVLLLIFYIIYGSSGLMRTSYTTQIVNLDENAGLQCLIITIEALRGKLRRIFDS
jgi:hypothetical protein